MGVEAAMVASTLLGTASSLHSASKQRSAQREAEERALRAQREAEERERQQAQELAGSESATIQYGIDEQRDNRTGTFSDFLVPKQTALGKQSGGSGLGFNV